MKKAGLYFRTLRHLKAIQLFFRVYYKFAKPKELEGTPDKIHPIKYPLEGQSSGDSEDVHFLNISASLSLPMDWEQLNHGKLWNYNLNYFDFLWELPVAKGQAIMEDFASQYREVRSGKEPYPTSLRIMNWVKYMSIQKNENPKLVEVLWKDSTRLMGGAEYHVLGNHLLENALALFFAAWFFRNERLYQKALGIFRKEEKEQFREDGLHFENSPMYHFILTGRLMDVWALVEKNPWHEELISPLKRRIEKALNMVRFFDVSEKWPLFNDSAYGISPQPKDLIDRGKRLGFDIPKHGVSGDSGYRKYTSKGLTAVLKAGEIGPDYIPGHGHADTLTYVLYDKDLPIVVDTGVSTYNDNEVRHRERSTPAHNCLVYNDQNTSEVWSSFRVGRRAKTVFLEDLGHQVKVAHNGYKKWGVRIEKTITLTDKGIRMRDLSNKGGARELKYYLHLAPGIKPEITPDKIKLIPNLEMTFSGIENLRVEDYQFSPEFNRQVPAKRIVMEVQGEVELHFVRTSP